MSSEQLEQEKLKLEIEALKRPFYKTLGFWSFVIALVGVFAQDYLSKLESTQAKIEVKEAQEALELVKQQIEEARNERDKWIIKVKELKLEANSINQKIAEEKAQAPENSPQRQALEKVENQVNTLQQRLNDLLQFKVKIRYLNNSTKSQNDAQRIESILKNKFKLKEI
ncbi:MAG: hypothetical protein QNJ64_01300 [Crocosphaera sp.]|nr:hypothetical protein [Crocosphaera sp.]